MDKFVDDYISRFISSINSIEVSDNNGNQITFVEGIKKVKKMILEIQRNKIIMVGNGGSASICSHQTIDYWKNGGIKSLCFNDSSLLTCLSNDFSFEEVFSKSIEFFADENDIVYCISSSGNSKNIENAAISSIKKGCKLVTFSGFDSDNRIRNIGDVNFYVPSNSYGFVETIHTLISHLILDSKLYLDDKIDIFNKNKKITNENL